MGAKWTCLLLTLTVITGRIHGTVDAWTYKSRLPSNVQEKREQVETSRPSSGMHHVSHNNISRIWKFIMALEVAVTRLGEIQTEIDGKITRMEKELKTDHGLDSAGLLRPQPVPDKAVVNTDVMDQLVRPSVPDQIDSVGHGIHTVPPALGDQTPGIFGEQPHQQHQQHDKQQENKPPQEDLKQQTPLQSQLEQQSQATPAPQQSSTQPKPSQGDHKQSQTTQLQHGQPTQGPPQEQQGAAGSKLSEIDEIIELASGLTRRHKARPPSQMRSSALSPPIWQDDRRAKLPPILQALDREGRVIEREGLPWMSIK